MKLLRIRSVEAGVDEIGFVGLTRGGDQVTGVARWYRAMQHDHPPAIEGLHCRSVSSRCHWHHQGRPCISASRSITLEYQV